MEKVIKEKCFAYDEKKHECLVLNDLNCKKCKFYKNKQLLSFKNTPIEPEKDFKGYNLRDIALLFSKN